MHQFAVCELFLVHVPQEPLLVMCQDSPSQTVVACEVCRVLGLGVPPSSVQIGPAGIGPVESFQLYWE